MEIPIALFSVIVAGLLGAYITFLYRLFLFSKDLDLDKNVTLQNLKTRELNIIKEFFDSHMNNKIQIDQIKPLMEERWKNAYLSYQMEDFIDNLEKREATGLVWSIIGIIGIVLSLVIYLLPWSCIKMFKIYPILVLCFIPLVVILILFIKNVNVRKQIRGIKKGIEKIWQF